MNRKNYILLTTFLLSSCSLLAPEYKLPAMEQPAKFKRTDEVTPLTNEEKTSWKQAEPKAHLDKGEWWVIFNDEELNKLQKDLLAENLDLKIMASRVAQARESVGMVTGELFPELSVNSNAIRQKQNSATFGFSAPPIKPFSVYSAGLGLNYELDFFGKTFMKRNVAVASAEALEEQKNSVKLALQADLAQHYFTLLSLNEEIRFLNESVSLLKEKVYINKKKVEFGSVSQVDTVADTVTLNNNISQLESLKQARNETETALAVLLGRSPSTFSFDDYGITAEAPNIPVGLPSALLERRPDISQAERYLYAANEQIGVARSAFFPSISLTANGGLESKNLTDLFQWSNRAWNIGPVLNFPIFEGGRAFANLEKNKAQYEEAVANYKKTVLMAFKDVEDSLSLVSTTSKQLEAQQSSQRSAMTALNMVEHRYKLGSSSKVDWIDAKVGCNNVKLVELQTKRTRLNASVQLIRALGGGFDFE